MFRLTEASTRRRAVGVGRPIAASSESILAGQSFMLRAIIGNDSTPPGERLHAGVARGLVPRL